MTVAPDLLMKGGLDQLERSVGPLTTQQRAAVDAWLPQLRQAFLAHVRQAAVTRPGLGQLLRRRQAQAR